MSLRKLKEELDRLTQNEVNLIKSDIQESVTNTIKFDFSVNNALTNAFNIENRFRTESEAYRNALYERFYYFFLNRLILIYGEKINVSFKKMFIVNYFINVSKKLKDILNIEHKDYDDEEYRKMSFNDYINKRYDELSQKAPTSDSVFGQNALNYTFLMFAIESLDSLMRDLGLKITGSRALYYKNIYYNLMDPMTIYKMTSHTSNNIIDFLLFLNEFVKTPVEYEKVLANLMNELKKSDFSDEQKTDGDDDNIAILDDFSIIKRDNKTMVKEVQGKIKSLIKSINYQSIIEDMIGDLMLHTKMTMVNKMTAYNGIIYEVAKAIMPYHLTNGIAYEKSQKQNDYKKEQEEEIYIKMISLEGTDEIYKNQQIQELSNEREALDDGSYISEFYIHLRTYDSYKRDKTNKIYYSETDDVNLVFDNDEFENRQHLFIALKSYLKSIITKKINPLLESQFIFNPEEIKFKFLMFNNKKLPTLILKYDDPFK